MNKKILISLSVMGVVAAIAIGGTIAYFSDTEISKGNLFKAGTIDIRVDGDNFTWEGGAVLEDMKPCYTDYINFVIYNDGSEPNPVNVWKHLTLDEYESGTGVVSEPECTDQGGEWLYDIETGEWYCDLKGHTDNNDIASIIDYDLLVEVYNSSGQLIWWQTIYDKEVTVGELFCKDIYLGMIPAGGYMEVEQSYHMQDLNYPTNWAQGDVMAFGIEIKGIQLRGTAWLENKDNSFNSWKIIHNDGIEGTLTYEVKHPTFDFSFTGKAPLANHVYYLVAGENTGSVPGTWDPDTELGFGTTDVNGNVTITENIELGKDMKDAKVWLVPVENWNGSKVTWGGWPGCVANFLWETGLIWYEDTDI